MLTILAKTHRFLSDHLFYPLALSTILALSLYAGRVIFSRNWVVYFNLIWNLFLAWLPYLFSLWAMALEHRRAGRWWLIWLPSALWLAFFPNAPYLLTDFFHLTQRPGIPLWYDIGLIAAFAWTGFFLALVSLRIMHLLVERYIGVFLGWLFALVSLGLAGLGLYLGRFSRWNSWDLLTSPKEILKETLWRTMNPLDNLSFYGFTLMFTGLMLVGYLVFIGVQRLNLPRQKSTSVSKT